MMDIDAPDESQCMVSAYFQSERPLSSVPGISLEQLFKDHEIESVDLLKMDIEGGEYAILQSTPSEVLKRVRNIVFEYHDVEEGWAKLESVKKRLPMKGMFFMSIVAWCLPCVHDAPTSSSDLGMEDGPRE